MLFDEPTSALDPEMINEVLDVMVELAKSGMTMIVVTHEMGFARKAANRVVFLSEGQIVEEADARGVLHQPQERARQGLPRQDPHPLTRPARAGAGTTTHRRHESTITRRNTDEEDPDRTRRGGGGPRARRERLRIGRPAAAAAPAAGGSAAADGIKIGIKFDQPGLGLKQGSDYTGMDVDVAKYVAKELGHEAERHPVGPGPQRPARDAHLHRPGRPRRRDVLDHRLPQGEGLLRRAVLHRRPGPPRQVRRHRHHRPGQPRRQEAVLGHRLDLGAEGQGRRFPGSTSRSSAPTPSASRPSSPARSTPLTTDDTILAGYAAQDQYKGKLKVVGSAFSEERYGIGLKKGDTALCQKVTDAITKMISDGEWQKVVDANLGPAGLQAAGRATRPPRTPAPDRPPRRR